MDGVSVALDVGLVGQRLEAGSGFITTCHYRILALVSGHPGFRVTGRPKSLSQQSHWEHGCRVWLVPGLSASVFSMRGMARRVAAPRVSRAQNRDHRPPTPGKACVCLPLTVRRPCLSQIASFYRNRSVALVCQSADPPVPVLSTTSPPTPPLLSLSHSFV